MFFFIDIPFKGSQSLLIMRLKVTTVTYLHSGAIDTAVQCTSHSRVIDTAVHVTAVSLIPLSMSQRCQ
jgi:hypothetical protein